MNLTMLSSVFQRVKRSFSTSPYLHLAATATIAFSLLIIGLFAILHVNINDLIRSWQQNIRVVAYLKNDLPENRIESLRQSLVELAGVEQVLYVSKDDAMARLKRQARHSAASLLAVICTVSVPPFQSALPSESFAVADASICTGLPLFWPSV